MRSGAAPEDARLDGRSDYLQVHRTRKHHDSDDRAGGALDFRPMTTEGAKPVSRGVTKLSRRPARGDDGARLTVRLDFGERGALGPGKIRLLEMIEETGSISAAGRAMAMSYRRAWLLVDSLNAMCQTPVVETQHGGQKGGGARLTTLGKALVARYRAIEAGAEAAMRSDIKAIERELA